MTFFKVALTTAAISLAGLAASQVFDLQNDFDAKANPRRSWSFGSGKKPTDFELYTNNKRVPQLYSSRGETELIGWSRPDSVFPYAAQNLGTVVLYQRWRPSEIALSPSADRLSVARWTNAAPSTKKVRLKVTFRRIENVTAYESDWYIVSNGVVVDSGVLDQGNEERSVTETLEVAGGGSISIVVGCKGHMEGTELGVSASITVK